MFESFIRHVFIPALGVSALVALIANLRALAREVRADLRRSA